MKLVSNVGGGLLNSLKVGTSIKDKLGGSKGITDKVTDVTTPDGDMGKKIEKGGKGIGKGMKGLGEGVGKV